MAFLLPALILLGAPPVADKAPKELVLAPSSPWNIQYEDETCSMIRSFGSGDSKISVQFDRYSPAPNFRPFFFGPMIKEMNGLERINLFIGSREFKYHEYYRYIIAPEKQDKVLVTSILPIYPKDGDKPVPLQGSAEADSIEQAITSVSLEINNRRTIKLQTGSLHKPLKAMRACMDDMMRQWGYDPKQYGLLRKGPTPRDERRPWITSDDYPSSALSDWQDGLIFFRLHVDEAGKATKCVVQSRIGKPVFAEQVCSLVMKRATFEPAQDANGKPVAAPYFRHVVWHIGFFD